MKMKNAYSLIEMLVVIAVFSILAVIVTQTMANSLRGSNKSESLGKARENVEYAMNVIERNLRNASNLDCTPDADNYPKLLYSSIDGRSYFKINTTGGYIAWGNDTSRITNTDVVVSGTFTCSSNDPTVPDSVEINISARASGDADPLGSTYTSQTTIVLRNK